MLHVHIRSFLSWISLNKHFLVQNTLHLCNASVLFTFKGKRKGRMPTEKNPYSYFILGKHLSVLEFNFITQAMKDETSTRRMQINLEK